MFADVVTPCLSAPKFSVVGQQFAVKLSASFMEGLVLGHVQVRGNCAAHKPKLNTAMTRAKAGKYTASP